MDNVKALKVFSSKNKLMVKVLKQDKTAESVLTAVISAILLQMK